MKAAITMVLGLLLGLAPWGLSQAASLTNLFPTAAATTGVSAAGGRLSWQGVQITVPPGDIGGTAKLTLLVGPNSSFPVSGSQTLLAFAISVVDQASGQPVTHFRVPLGFSFTAPGIGSASQYLNVLPNGQITPNVIPAKISGHTLSHAIAGTVVGWVVTGSATSVTPASLPATGVPSPFWYLGGALVLLGGGLYLRRRSA